MDERAFEQMLELLMGKDLSGGTEAFRDSLLERCLSELNADEVAEVDDADLDLLAAAGNPFLPGGQEPDDTSDDGGMS